MNDRSSARPAAAGFIPRLVPPKKPVRPSVRPVPKRAASGAGSLEPTILLVGADSAFEPALRAALARHRVYVETTTAEAVAETVIAAAPDLVLLVGPAARDGGSGVLETLMSSPVSSVIPVAILDDDAALDARLRAFRHGAAAVIPPSASIDAIAEQVAKLAREIPERGGESLGVVGEATLSEFVGALSKELRSGILSVHTGKGGDEDAVRLVLGSGRPLAAFIDDFVRQVKSHVVHAEPLHYEFAEHASGTVALLDPDAPSDEPERVSVKGLRVALADDDTGRADSVAQELRSRGVQVVVTDLKPSDLRFAKLRQVDPEILLIGESQVKGAGYELLRRMRRDTRLRWASLLVVRWEEIWSDALSVPALDRLETALAALSEADRTLHAWSETGEAFDARLEITGPARCLRAITASPKPLRVTVNNPRITLSIDISDGLVVGATADSRSGPEQHWDGAVALSAFMVLSSGRIHIAPVNQPAQTNVMATIDVALNMADSEPSPIAPSIPSAAASSLRPPAGELPISTSLPPVAPQPEAAEQGVVMKSRGRTGVSRPAAIFLVALAALQGLIIVAALSALTKSHRAHVAAASSTSSAVLSSALPALEPPPRASVVATNSATPTPSAANAPPTAPAAEAAAAPASKDIPIDETGMRAPTCDELFGGANVGAGEYPGSAYLQIKEANKALVRGDVDSAERSLCKAVLWDQKNPAIPLELAQLMLLRRDGKASVEWAQKGLEKDAASLRAQSILGDGLARVGDYEGAKRAWLLSLQIDEASDAKYKALSFTSAREARASLVRRDFARAERFFRRAVVLDPENAAASIGLADALLRLGDTASALRWANRAVSVVPRDPAARVVLGDVLFQKGEAGPAEVEWREALQLDPSNFLARRRVNRLAQNP
ncbi:MAG TPA: tetratricopeptide repeat protein [Polyangiaceae bacterium]|jgi:tetratricopeptide (TPR) repeat protein/DNA-binding NarL/FixJ family response regulator